MTLKPTGKVYNCNDLNVYFPLNHTFLKSSTDSCPLYKDIHDLYMHPQRHSIYYNTIWINKHINKTINVFIGNQGKIIHRILPSNYWLKNIKIKPDSKCTYCNSIDSITNFLIECKSNNLLWKSWSQSMTKLNTRDEPHIHQSILFGFPRRSDDAILIKYCILYAKRNLKTIRNRMHIQIFGLTIPAQISIKNRKLTYVFGEIKLSSSTSLIVQMATFRLYTCETLL